MTCSGCEATVTKLLSGIKDVSHVKPDFSRNLVTIEMRKHIPTETFQQALKDYPKYRIIENGYADASTVEKEQSNKSWFQTYKPVLLIFGYITAITFLVETQRPFSWTHWMNNFMGGFFLTFSFFKLLDLKGFAQSYSSYDIIARKWPGYGYVYAFTELALGIAYITSFDPLLTNSVTFVIMSLSIIGVLRSVFNKRKIKCACLGSVFNLPMSTITIIEDALMIVMSLAAILTSLTVM